ncbi:hypothetical protein ACVWW1_001831 [Bradyrhizobium sp. JR3.5]
MAAAELALQPPGDGGAAAIEQAGIGEQQHAAAERADQPAAGMLLAQPGAGAVILRLQALGSEMIDQAAGNDDRVACGPLADGTIDGEQLPATCADRLAIERERLPTEACLAAAQLHHVVGEREDIGDAGDRRLHAAFHGEDRKLHGTSGICRHPSRSVRSGHGRYCPISVRSATA